MANVTYTVQQGDTLWAIARKYNTTPEAIAALNPDKIVDINRIGVGWTIIISGEPAATKTPTSNQRVTLNDVSLQSDTDRTVFVTWEWGYHDETDHYEVEWTYYTSDGQPFPADTPTNVHKRISVYPAPSNARWVEVVVTPVSKTFKDSNKNDATHFTGKESTVKKYTFALTPPAAVSPPTVTIDGYTLTARVDNLPTNIRLVEFNIVRNDVNNIGTYPVTVKKQTASLQISVDAGYEYKVRCRVTSTDNLISDWSDYSGNAGTAPAPSRGIKERRALTQTSIKVIWYAISNATSYEIEYTTSKKYFDSSNEVSKVVVDGSVHHAELTGLEPGKEYFFRVRGINAQGESPWTDIDSLVLGKKPSAPTTWSSTTTAKVGDSIILYWTHNSEDGSKQTSADVEVIVNGNKTIYEYTSLPTDDEEPETPYGYEIVTTGYPQGSIILWRVRTKGILDADGDWSAQRRIEVYAPPTLTLKVSDYNGATAYQLTSFPMTISGVAGPYLQTPVGYALSITSNSSYATVDNYGNPKRVNMGEAVYSKYFDTSGNLSVSLSANDLDLENNKSYTVRCVVSMNSGLTAESTWIFTVAWGDYLYEPNMAISYNPDTYTTSINPYCTNMEGVLLSDVELSVYRREFDGGFTEIATGVDNMAGTFVVDPHPSLDYARYRIVARSKKTGAIGYFDPPGLPIGCESIIIQWNEDWVNFTGYDSDGEVLPLSAPPWTGSLLVLPYNVDVSDKYNPDVAMIEYIGRKHPVSYSGTQIGMTSTWKTDIMKSDVDTLFALRRLAQWMGNVYVREPSGSGYWASIRVAFNQNHKEGIIPVTLDITRVAGGM